MTSGAQPCIPAAPCGAEEASTTRRGEIGPDEGDLLRDEAADREAEEIHPLEAHRLDEGDRTVSHRLDGVGCRAARSGDADVVEGNDPSIRSQRVDQRGIPVVEVPAKVLQQDERHVALTNVAVGVVDPVLGDNPQE